MTTTKWIRSKQLVESGQAYLDIVRSSEASGQYVCKTLKNPKRARRFTTEVESIKRLFVAGVPVVEIIDADEESTRGPRSNNCPFYVMPHYQRGSLQEALDASPGVPYAGSVGEALKAFYQLAIGLRRVHEQGVVHRDLKPANVLIDDNGGLLLADFGLAFDVHASHGERETATLEQVGSRHYIAPEDLNGRAESPTEASDIYALGKIMSYMLTGRQLASLFPSPSDVGAIPHDSEASLRTCVLAMTQQDPARRIRNWSSCLDVIRNILHPEMVMPVARRQDATFSGIDPARLLEMESAQQAIEARTKIRLEFLRQQNDALQQLREYVVSHPTIVHAMELAKRIGWQVAEPGGWEFDGREFIDEAGQPFPLSEHTLSLIFIRPRIGIAFVAVACARRGQASEFGIPFQISVAAGLHSLSFRNDGAPQVVNAFESKTRDYDPVDPNALATITEACEAIIARLPSWFEELFNA